ncbi:acyl-CoA/acyl-ACP dehydrogenase [Actinomadura barringtoniae]|uniref:Acyl-CoA/acyl-ACP dehydrogenase n=1 Tax=Actinomadura barringtoniae TaxID=1427535 RepID=A0A939P7M2_9ACTN|nr:acyl-CoA dehydrogenase family protein [Actinomadura barringtoniae]MBO2447073.1 acyl-CoA/acyl-ACP dehydrogenase [Actinomadura barringtoniae]
MTCSDSSTARSPRSPRRPRSPRPPSLLDELYAGHVRWDLVRPFPRQSAAERAAGDEAVAAVTDLLRTWIDPEEVDRTGRLPDGFQAALGKAGFLRLMIDPALGGLGLSWANAARVVEATARWSAPVAYTVAITNGFGSGSYLPVLPPGPLRDLIEARVAGGIVSGGADAEPIGTANQHRATTAVPVEDGAAYLITGEKVFIGNAPVADLMDVSATIDGTGEVRLFFVDLDAPGVEHVMRHEFMGLRGAEIGAIRFDNVRVAAERLLPESEDGWRMRPGEGTSGEADSSEADSGEADSGELAALALSARNLVVTPTTLGIARMCLVWTRDFLGRRVIDGRGLGEYDQIQRLVSATAADVFTIESLLAWSVLGGDQADLRPDLTAVKNLVSRLCWRTVDRTVSLLGAEGYETARSKAARGAVPLPVERAFRDARALRVAGGVDFMLDMWSAKSRPPLAPETRLPGLTPHDTALTSRNEMHLAFVAAQSRSLADIRGDDQHTLGVAGAIAAELLSMTVVLARSADLPDAADLADVSCTASRHRLAELRSRLGDRDRDAAATSDASLHTARFDFLTRT